MTLATNCEIFLPLTTNSLTELIAGHAFTATNFAYNGTDSWHPTSNGAGVLVCDDLTLSEPCTFAAQVYVGGGVGSVACFIGYAKTDTDYLTMVQGGANVVQAAARHSSTFGTADGGGVSGSAFNDCATVFTSDTSRQAYLAGTLSAAETTNVPYAGSSTRLSIGALKLPIAGSVQQGCDTTWRFKNVAVWSRVLTQAELISYFANPSAVLGGPVLSSPTGTALTSTTASGTVSTTGSTGTLYFYASTNATESVATIKASGSSQAVSGSGAQSVGFTGLTPSTTYYAHYVHTDGSSVDSAAANSASFTTSAGAITSAYMASTTRPLFGRSTFGLKR